MRRVILVAGIFVAILMLNTSSATRFSLNSSTQGVDTVKDLSMDPVDEKNISVLLNLGQAYEAEFSALTGKIPDDKGIFHLDTMPVEPYVGYLLYEGTTPIGFCVLEIHSGPVDVSEFYIIPSQRKKKIGMHFAYALFDKYPGLWQVRQIQGADHAVKFWRHVISAYTVNNYKEDIVEDPDWGFVTRQTFSSIKE